MNKNTHHLNNNQPYTPLPPPLTTHPLNQIPNGGHLPPASLPPPHQLNTELQTLFPPHTLRPHPPASSISQPPQLDHTAIFKAVKAFAEAGKTAHLSHALKNLVINETLVVPYEHLVRSIINVGADNVALQLIQHAAQETNLPFRFSPFLQIWLQRASTLNCPKTTRELTQLITQLVPHPVSSLPSSLTTDSTTITSNVAQPNGSPQTSLPAELVKAVFTGDVNRLRMESDNLQLSAVNHNAFCELIDNALEAGKDECALLLIRHFLEKCSYYYMKVNELEKIGTIVAQWLHVACRKGCSECVNYLLSRSVPFAKSDSTSLLCHVHKMATEVLSGLLASKSLELFSPEESDPQKHYEFLEKLVELSLDPSKKMTPILTKFLNDSRLHIVENLSYKKYLIAYAICINPYDLGCFYLNPSFQNHDFFNLKMSLEGRAIDKLAPQNTHELINQPVEARLARRNEILKLLQISEDLIAEPSDRLMDKFIQAVDGNNHALIKQIIQAPNFKMNLLESAYKKRLLVEAVRNNNLELLVKVLDDPDLALFQRVGHQYEEFGYEFIEELTDNLTDSNQQLLAEFIYHHLNRINEPQNEHFKNYLLAYIIYKKKIANLLHSAEFSEFNTKNEVRGRIQKLVDAGIDRIKGSASNKEEVRKTTNRNKIKTILNKANLSGMTTIPQPSTSADLQSTTTTTTSLSPLASPPSPSVVTPPPTNVATTAPLPSVPNDSFQTAWEALSPSEQLQIRQEFQRIIHQIVDKWFSNEQINEQFVTSMVNQRGLMRFDIDTFPNKEQLFSLFYNFLRPYIPLDINNPKKNTIGNLATIFLRSMFYQKHKSSLTNTINLKMNDLNSFIESIKISCLNEENALPKKLRVNETIAKELGQTLVDLLRLQIQIRTHFWIDRFYNSTLAERKTDHPVPLFLVSKDKEHAHIDLMQFVMSYQIEGLTAIADYNLSAFKLLLSHCPEAKMTIATDDQGRVKTWLDKFYICNPQVPKPTIVFREEDHSPNPRISAKLTLEQFQKLSEAVNKKKEKDSQEKTAEVNNKRVNIPEFIIIERILPRYAKQRENTSATQNNPDIEASFPSSPENAGTASPAESQPMVIECSEENSQEKVEWGNLETTAEATKRPREKVSESKKGLKKRKKLAVEGAYQEISSLTPLSTSANRQKSKGGGNLEPLNSPFVFGNNSINSTVDLQNLFSSISLISAQKIEQEVGHEVVKGRMLEGAQPLDYPIVEKMTHIPPIDSDRFPLFNLLLKKYQVTEAALTTAFHKAGVSRNIIMEMGLGKTATFLEVLLQYIKTGHSHPFAVFCPKPIVESITDDLRRFLVESIYTAWRLYFQEAEAGRVHAETAYREGVALVQNTLNNAQASEHDLRLAALVYSALPEKMRESQARQAAAFVQKILIDAQADERNLNTAALFYRAIPNSLKSWCAWSESIGENTSERTPEEKTIGERRKQVFERFREFFDSNPRIWELFQTQAANFSTDSRLLLRLQYLELNDAQKQTIRDLAPGKYDALDDTAIRCELPDASLYTLEEINRIRALPPQSIQGNSDPHGLANAYAKNPAIIVTTASSIRKAENLENLPFAGAVIDEVHLFKKGKIDHDALLPVLAKLGPTDLSVGVTGTPYQNDTSDIWNILRLLAKGNEFSDHTFNNLTRLHTDTRNQLVDESLTAFAERKDEPEKDLSFAKNLLRSFSQFYTLKKYVLDRLICHVHSKHENVMHELGTNGPQRKDRKLNIAFAGEIGSKAKEIFQSYSKGKLSEFLFEQKILRLLLHTSFENESLDANKKSSIIEAAIELFKTSSDPEEEAKRIEARKTFIEESPLLKALLQSKKIKEIFPDIINGRGKRVIFIIQHVATARLLEAVLTHYFAEYQPETQLYEGDLKTESRKKVSNWFKSREETSYPKLLFLMQKVGGVGLNFPEADMLFQISATWTPAQEEQGIYRMLRMNAKGIKHVIHLKVDNFLFAHKKLVKEAKKKMEKFILETSDNLNVNFDNWCDYILWAAYKECLNKSKSKKATEAEALQLAEERYHNAKAYLDKIKAEYYKEDKMQEALAKIKPVCAA